MPRPHPPEFRHRAVELARLREKPVAKIAEELGISDSCRRNWMSQADIDDGRRPGLTSDERAELVKLRREKRVLETEIEILKRVTPLADDVGPSRQRTVVGPAGSVPQAVNAFVVVAPLPRVEALAADPVVPARQGDVAGHFLGVEEDRQAPLGLPGELLLGHQVSQSREDPSVNNLCQFQIYETGGGRFAR